MLWIILGYTPMQEQRAGNVSRQPHPIKLRLFADDDSQLPKVVEINCLFEANLFRANPLSERAGNGRVSSLRGCQADLIIFSAIIVPSRVVREKEGEFEGQILFRAEPKKDAALAVLF